MNPFIAGFADELFKLGAFKYEMTPQVSPDPAKATVKAFKNLQPKAWKGKVPGQEVGSFAPRSGPINPLTSPNQVTGYKQD
jgi:hypothetical protein